MMLDMRLVWFSCPSQLGHARKQFAAFSVKRLVHVNMETMVGGQTTVILSKSMCAIKPVYGCCEHRNFSTKPNT